MKWFWVIVVALAAGCTKPNPASCVDNHCSDPERPFCDADGTIGGEPDTCIAVDCAPNAFEMCQGGRALSCNATGDNYQLVECEFGCDDAVGCKPCDAPECEKHIIPRYVPNICNEVAPPSDLTINTNETFDTTNPLNCTAVINQTSGPPICVLHYRSITVAPNQTLTIVGTHALALVADRELKIDGVLDASASLTTNGPGGGTRKSGSSPGGDSAGGGAGHRTAGGHGGNSASTGGASNGGTTTPNPSSQLELFGGTQPEQGAGRTPGGGGGAVTLISCRGTVTIAGIVDVGGGGGLGRQVQSPFLSASGGGAGGVVVLQGMAVRATGQLYANGGGGGSGGGASGTDGLRSTTAAPGGPTGGLSNSGGAGGSGGAMSLAGGDGLGGSMFGTYGAGGGGTGFLLVYTPQGVAPTLTPTTISPQFELPTGTIPTN